MADSTQNTEGSGASLASNILAIVGFIILIVVVIWGLVHLASLSRGWFSSLFGASTVIEVTAPTEAISGMPFTVSWEYDEPTPGSYALLYQCEDGLQLQTPALAAGFKNGIPCGAAFTVSSETKEISITPRVLGSVVLEVPISILFLPSSTSTKQAQGSATIAIAPSEEVVVEPAPTVVEEPSTPAPTAPTVSSAPADLSVRIMSVNVDATGQGVATFDIANVGGRSSGTYYFTAQLPTFAGYTYSSPAQISLAPGAHITSTLRFSGGTAGIVSVSITTPDANAGNNYASQSVSTSYYSPYTPNYNTYTPQYQTYPYTNQYPYNTYNQNYPYSTQYPYVY